jgi:hypothetical protein
VCPRRSADGVQVVKVPVSDAVWSTWRRYCEALGMSMGAGVARLIVGELETVVEVEGTTAAQLADQLTQHAEERSLRLDARQRGLEAQAEGLRRKEERLRTWERTLRTPQAVENRDNVKVGAKRALSVWIGSQIQALPRRPTPAIALTCSWSPAGHPGWAV